MSETNNTIPTNQIDQTNSEVELQKTYGMIITIGWILTIIITIVLTILNFIFYKDVWYAWPVSFILGAMVNFFTFNLLRNYIVSLTSDVKSGISSSFSNYIIRFAIYGFVFYIALQNAVLNEYIVASGFIIIRVAIYIYSYLNRSK
jgi:hypothetical protein